MTSAPRPPTPSRLNVPLDFDLSSERDVVEVTLDDAPEDPVADAPYAQEVVITGVHLSTLQWFVLALRVGFAGTAAAAVVAPFVIAVSLALIAATRLAWAALGS